MKLARGLTRWHRRHLLFSGAAVSDQRKAMARKWRQPFGSGNAAFAPPVDRTDSADADLAILAAIQVWPPAQGNLIVTLPVSSRRSAGGDCADLIVRLGDGSA